MLIVGRGLLELAQSNVITSEATGIEDFSICLHLGSTIRRYRAEATPLSVSQNVRDTDIESFEINHEPLILAHGEGVLACTAETVSMPPGYMGIIQTKGTIARFLLQATCSDGQVEPGFKGRVTLELVNFNPRPLSLSAMTPICQMFIFKTQPKAPEIYQGRYQGATGPTLPRPIR